MFAVILAHPYSLLSLYVVSQSSFSSVVYKCLPTASKAQCHPKSVCPIQLISVRFDRGKVFRSVKTL